MEDICVQNQIEIKDRIQLKRLLFYFATRNIHVINLKEE